MNSTPERDGPGQRGGAPEGTHPGVPAQEEAKPGYDQHGGGPYGTEAGQPAGAAAGAAWGGTPAEQAPVDLAATRVTGRRVVQYLIDSFLVWIIPGLVSIPFDRSNSTFLHILGGIISFAIFVLIGLAYWVVWPHARNGQTLGMKLLGLRVISKGGGPANLAQLFIRWVCLIFDAIPYTWPFTGLVGFIVILCSRERQRIGDHLARTLVVSTGDSRFGGGSRGPA
jgi:uncharacterized RDD family membrane protein YckC